MSATSTLAEPLVLVVDDSVDSRTMYAEYLSFCGFRVAEAANGADAIREATRLMPDAIVTDIVLPITDGWEVARLLKENAATRHIPIVALTGYSPSAEQAKLRVAGFDAFFVKPCSPDTLVARLKELIGREKA